MSSQTFQSQLPQPNDRMVTTLFLAALLHGIVILGVTFSSPGGDADNDQAPGLEVILVNDNAQSVKRNAKARYLAQRNQEGSGNTLSPDRALIPKSSLAPAVRPGAANGDGVDLHQAGHDAGDAQTLATLQPVDANRLLRGRRRRPGLGRNAAAAREAPGFRHGSQR